MHQRSHFEYFFKIYDDFLLPATLVLGLGRTGLQVFPIGFGGIAVMDAEPDRAGRIVAEAAECGINYFDVAPSYGDAEVKLVS